MHFIFRHKDKRTGVIEEKKLKNPPGALITKESTLYTLVVGADNSFEILVNNESVRKGSLLEDFEPSVNEPKEILDPEDKKPADWVDDETIVDVTAIKPKDW